MNSNFDLLVAHGGKLSRIKAKYFIKPDDIDNHEPLSLTEVSETVSVHESELISRIHKR
jgi:hypothetical protein